MSSHTVCQALVEVVGHSSGADNAGGHVGVAKSSEHDKVKCCALTKATLGC